MSCCIYLAMQANDSLKIFDDRKLYVFLSFSHFFLRQAFQPCNMLNGRCFKAVWIQRNAKETKSVSESLSEARKNIVWQKYICPHLKAMWRSSKQHHPDHWEESCPNHILWCGLYTAFIILILFFPFFLFFPIKSCPSVATQPQFTPSLSPQH